MPSSNEYRVHAAECLRLSREVNDPELKARFVQMAQAWNELADRLDQNAVDKKV